MKCRLIVLNGVVLHIRVELSAEEAKTHSSLEGKCISIYFGFRGDVHLDPQPIGIRVVQPYLVLFTISLR